MKWTVSHYIDISLNHNILFYLFPNTYLLNMFPVYDFFKKKKPRDNVSPGFVFVTIVWCGERGGVGNKCATHFVSRRKKISRLW